MSPEYDLGLADSKSIFLTHDDAMIPTFLMILMYQQINALQRYKGYRTMYVIVVARA